MILTVAQTATPVAQTAQRSRDGVLSGIERALEVPLITVGDLTLTAGHILAVFLLFIVGVVLSRTAQSVLSRTMRRRGIGDEGLIGATQRLIHYTVLIVVAGYALQVVGVDLRALFAAGAVAAVAVGFALQNILQNFVSGVIILMERSITPGDVLGVDGKMVKVEKMNIRTTVARTLDDEEIIIPNSALVQTHVTNYTLSDELYRLRTRVGVAYASDVDEVLIILLQAGRGVSARAPSKDPVVHLREFGDSALIFEVSIWLEDPWTARTHLSAFNIGIWRALREAGVTIAFPQLDVHMHGQLELPGVTPRT